MNRKFVLTAVVVCAVLALVASPWFFPDATEGRNSIRVIGEAYAPLEALEKMKGEFEEEFGVSVEIVQKDHQAVVSELDQELASRNVTYDVILMPHRLMGKLVEKDRVQPIGDLLDARNVDGSLISRWHEEIACYDGNVYGYPFTCLTMYVCYRKDLLEDPSEQEEFLAKYGRKLAPPADWDEYYQVAEFFNRPDNGMYGTYIQGQQGISLWYEWLNFSYSFGGSILDTEHGWEYGDIVVNSPENIAATEMYMKLAKVSSPETLNYNWDDALANLQQGRAFMGILWHDQTPYLEDPEQSKVAGKIGYTLVPAKDGDSGIAQLEGWAYLIPKESQNPTDAAKFIQWAMRKDVQLRQTLAGGASSLAATYENEEVQKVPYIPTFAEALKRGVPKPTIPESSQITEIMQQGLSKIITGKVGVSAGLDEIAVEIKRVLGDKAKMRYPVGEETLQKAA